MIKILGSHLIIRLAALTLAASCARMFYASVPAYQSHLERKKGDFSSAGIFAKTAYERGERDPSFLESRAEGIEGEALKTRETTALRLASEAYREVFKKRPLSGKIQLKTIQLEILALESEGKLTPEVWSLLQRDLIDAQRLRPGNAWTAFMTGAEMLRRKRFLKAEDARKAWNFIKQSAEWDPKNYAGPALDYGIHQNVSARVLFDLIPDSYEGHFYAAQYFQSKEEWSLWSPVYRRMVFFRGKFYDALCDQAEKALDEGQLREAFDNYNKALWLDSVPGRALAGQALCLFYLEGKSFQTAEDELEKALEENESIGLLGELLQRPEAPFLGDYLRGLLSYKAGQFKEAVSHFEKVKNEKKYRDYYQASAKVNAGIIADSFNRLEIKKDDGTANVRELLLLLSLRPDLGAEVEKSLNSMLTRSRPSRAWWDTDTARTRLEAGQKSGMLVSLLPGKTRVWIAARMKSPDSSGAGLLFRLSGKLTASAAVDSEKWESVSFVMDSPGGKYWLSVERLTGESSPANKADVELGEVRLLHLPPQNTEKTITEEIA